MRKTIPLFLALAAGVMGQQCEPRYEPVRGGKIAYTPVSEHHDPEHRQGFINTLNVNLRQPRFGGKFNDMMGIQVEGMRKQNVISPVESFDANAYGKALFEVRRELSSYGLPANFSLNPVRTIEDLLTDEKSLFLVGGVFQRVWADIQVLHRSGKQTDIKMDNDFVLGGEVAVLYEVTGDQITACRYGPFIQAQTRPVRQYSVVFCEALHSFTGPRCVEALVKSGKYKPHELADISLKMDEALVHGLCYAWLRDNRPQFDLSRREIKESEDFHLRLEAYRGMRTVKRLAEEKGRSELIKEYFADPVQFWKRIEPVFRH